MSTIKNPPGVTTQRRLDLDQTGQADQAGATQAPQTAGDAAPAAQSPSADAPDAAIAQGTAGDFAATQGQPQTGASPMSVRLGAATQASGGPSIDQVVDSIGADDWYLAKDVMTSDEYSAYWDGDMTGQQLLDIVKRGKQPQSASQLEGMFNPHDWGAMMGVISDGDKAKLDGGQMTYQSMLAVQEQAWAKMEADAMAQHGVPDGDDAPAGLPGANAQAVKERFSYPRTDIINRVESGQSHNVMFGGQPMDRALLKAALKSIQGQGDGRVSKKDIDNLLPSLLDGGSVTTAEENTLLFMFQHCNFTKPAAEKLSKALADAFPDSAIAKMGGLMSAPKLAGFDQYDLLDLTDRTIDLYAAKFVMTPDEMSAFFNNEMSLMQLNNVLQRGYEPMSADDLLTLDSYTTQEAMGAMTPDERKRFDSGRMSAAEVANISYRASEEANPSFAGLTPYDPSFSPNFEPLLVDNVKVSTQELQQLEGKLNVLKAQLQSHLDPGEVAKNFPADIFQMQQSIGMEAGQFVAEAIGLDSGGGAGAKLADLKSVDFDTSTIEPFGPGSFMIYGEATMKDGSKVDLEMLLDADYQLTSAVG